MTIHQLHQLFLSSKGVCTDTRKIEKNTLFFALKGENFDGNSYAKIAVESGASYAIIDDPKYQISDKHILVTDALKTLQNLALYHRQHLKIPVIALTGSNGKTTTKELINSVLSSGFKTCATSGNLNNHIGVPLTLLSMNTSTEIGIVEMGANHVGEIALLSEITNPDYGYITNIGKAHLEGFKSIEGVLKGKTELYKNLKKNNKLVFLNIDDPKLKKASLEIDTFSFSISEQADVTVKLLNTSPTVVVGYEDIQIHTHLIGAYNFTNIAAAIAIGAYFKIPIDKIKKAIEAYIPSNNRSQILKQGEHTIILDAYNANPTSMKAAIDSFSESHYESKIVVLGDMFELGNDAANEHQEIVNHTCTTTIDEIFLVGTNFFATISDDSRVRKFKSFEDLERQLNLQNKKSTILIKGSRGMKLERVVSVI
ncbi:UDP-N-acetylmuramoyl-tripeptide--D-alanyl-D-alanine ligase [Aquimarina pacifica]|uniref:UDP-N-acetylmuramoyl-tripeptide--D-alanyl-D- alanine ligase n=1 Tax=Aquimarina pacifica TaxID=1296415 RepID=UPI00047014FF|nr:UDP-N-acetylmuramoyl-tripeptide--D-alanyl-D-alanine ligase [Aquimarina pacifica]